jgi:TrmH family RNA methyltransferase
MVRRLRALASHPEPDGAHLLLDGVHLVQAAVDAGLRFGAVAVAASRVTDGSDEGRLARALEARGVAVTMVADTVLAAVSPVRTPTGLVAVVALPPTSPDAACAGEAPFVLGLLAIQDPGNLGALLRVAEAAGVTGALVGAGSASPFSWKAVRGSMGAVLRLPVAAGLPPDAVLARMQARGLRTVAAVPRGGRAPGEVDWTGAVGLLLGGEGPGLDPGVIDGCDAQVSVPMASAVESLNVATAGAVLVYAARQQRA